MSVPLDWCMDVIYKSDPTKLTDLVLKACHHYGIPDFLIDQVSHAPVQTIQKPERFELIQNLARRWKHNSHYGYPMPDERGRPKLSWLVCAHPACGNECSHPSELTNHLINNKAYTRGFHLAHELAIKERALTKDKVIKDNLTQCPSLICDVGCFTTPHDLIDHLTRLGMDGFWQNTLVLDPVRDPAIDMNCVIQQSCIACNADSQIVCIPCGHCAVCADCFKPFDECLVCGLKVNNLMLL
jgi:hypothetical protein